MTRSTVRIGGFRKIANKIQ